MSEKQSNAADAAEQTESGPELGHFGQLLAKKDFHPIALEPDACGFEMIEISRDELVAVSEYLRDEQKFDMLLSVSAVDMKEYRLSVIHLYSLDTHKTLVLKTRCCEEDHCPSVMSVWPAVDWHEREAYDLMGIHYDGHPDLRRILMPVDWIGHPLRKDYVENDPRLVWNRR
jgi:NADH-quinone oxidoreductase subunit C